MKRLPWALALLIGCKTDTNLNVVDARLAFSPELVNLDPVVVGNELPFTVTLEHLQGTTVEVLGIEVVNLQGESFSYLGDDGFFIDPGATEELEFLYRPDDVGFHLAGLFVTTNARDGQFSIEARGSGTTPAAVVLPPVLDFGPVTAPDLGTADLIVQNEGATPLTLTAASISDARFALVAQLPLTLEAETQVTLPLSFTPIADEQAQATLTLQLDGFALDAVTLKANDCESGDVARYDQDADGWTSCAGDCDDLDATVFPGAAELVDLTDQDCDGDIDEGTSGYDDDGDGYCDDPLTCSDGSLPGDCNDGASAVNPGVDEIAANGLDDDCDGAIDDGALDGDGDGVSVGGGDCDDADPAVFPGAPELPDGADNDCDGTVDEHTTQADDDGDGYCEGPICSDGSAPGDCDDSTPSTSPVANELPDGIDNDCDGDVDEGTVNDDADGDGFTPAGGDCDDHDPDVNPARGNC